MKPFATLDTALEAEGVYAKPELLAFIPQQQFFPTLELAAAWLSGAWASARKPTSKLIYCSDGVSKGICGSTREVDTEMIPLLRRHTGSDIIVVDVCAVTGDSPGNLHASAKHMPALRHALCNLSASDLVLAVGSGTVTDLIKHALFLEQSPATFAVLPTALTVTAFTSAFSVLDEGGAKRTRPSRPVDHVAWVSEVLAAAPIAMSRAGYGDLLARFVAMGDWYLSYELGLMPSYDERAYRLMEVFAPMLRADAIGFGESIPSQELVERTSAALSMAGIAMSVSGQTTPLSGFEHVISHALDFLHITSGAPMPYHGEQVALASLSSATAFDWFLAKDELVAPQAVILDDNAARKLVEQLVRTAPLTERPDDARLKSACDEFLGEFLKKNAIWKGPGQEALKQASARWPDVRAKLRSLVMPSAEMEALLRAAKLPLSPEETSPPTSALEYRWAVRFAPFVRGRPSLADILFFFGEDPALAAAC